ncbi:MAG: hypothetical protein KF789_05630 [Bdellovibrionaceae bacterium]|nr:hypothetical protein [Pseudobdellovibrionaceae bacterium]
MAKMKRILRVHSLSFIVCGAVVLSALGCASSPVKASQARLVTADRILGETVAKSPNPANVTVVCDKGLGGMAILFKVDGKEVAKIYSGEKIEFKIDPGSHIFAIKSWEGTHVEVETLLKENEKAFYRIFIPGYGVTIQKSAEIGDN